MFRSGTVYAKHSISYSNKHTRQVHGTIDASVVLCASKMHTTYGHGTLYASKQEAYHA